MNQTYLSQIKNKLSPTLFTSLKAFFSTWALMRIGSFHSMDIIGLVLFLLLFYFFHCNTAKYEAAIKKTSSSTLFFKNNIPETELYKVLFRQKYLFSCLFSALFAAMYLAGSYKNVVSDVSNSFFQLFLIIVTYIGLFLLLREVLQSLDSLLLSLFLKKEMISSSKKIQVSFFPFNNFSNKKILPGFCFLFCVLCRIPYFLYSYPGIMTPDSINQIEQILGLKAYSNHHPWLHTLTISLFYHIGTLFTENRNLAFACYTLFQIIFMAAAAAYLIYVLSKYIKSSGLLLGMIFFYGLIPYHNVMALCIWKDVLFSGSVLIFCTSFFDLLKMQNKNINKIESIPPISRKAYSGTTILYFISGFFLCLYRSNGWYAFLFSFPFLLAVFWKHRKIMLPLHLLLLLLVLLVKGPVMDHYNVRQPDFVESLSIPLQQVGRVIAENHPLTVAEKEQLDYIMDRKYVPSLYTEYISDPMKELVRANNPEYLSSHKADYFILWLRLGLKYPATYIEAYLEQTKGFYSPSTIYSVAEVDGIIDNDCGITREYLLRGKLIVKIREILLKLQDIIPIYGALWSMGSLFWLTLLLFYLTIIKKINKTFYFTGCADEKNNETLPLYSLFCLWLPCIAIILTLLLATPVAIEFRYAYHLAYCLPLYLGIFVSE